MKKTYMTPIVNVENAWPSTLLCVSFKSDVDLTQGTGSDGEARAPESEWEIWGDE